MSDIRDPSAPRPLDARRALVILTVYLLAQIGIAIVFMIVAVVSLGSAVPRSELVDQVQSVALMPAALAGMSAAAVLVFRMTQRTLPGSVTSGALDSVGWFLGSRQSLLVSAAIGATISAFVVFVLIPHTPTSSRHSLDAVSRAVANRGLSRLCWAVLVLGVAPPVEEFLFRGVLLEGFRRSWGVMAASLLVTGLFIAMHLPQIRYWPALAGVSTLAVAALCVRLVTGALGPALVLHLAYNYVLVFVVYLRG